ncbi:hypothetical protein GGE12_001102 [Rhizobium mongolense]|uniref:Uncharacterized protein n=1 Tax=Rhizobium mongolense TaxID=57676 RepID=A0A7W6RJZ2_9HYPH|nr:hypothetical protein [Rhizobium mongolense]
MKADELKRLARALRWDYRVVALARDLAIASALAVGRYDAVPSRKPIRNRS